MNKSDFVITLIQRTFLHMATTCHLDAERTSLPHLDAVRTSIPHLDACHPLPERLMAVHGGHPVPLDRQASGGRVAEHVGLAGNLLQEHLR